MDTKSTLNMIIQLALVFPFIILLIYLSLKFGGSKLQQLQNGRFIKILERVPLSKENSILAVKIGQKGYVVSSTNGKVEILIEIDDIELKLLEDKSVLPRYDNLNELYKSFLTKRKVKDD
jgi:flagellar protein FliO/FliZ